MTVIDDMNKALADNETARTTALAAVNAAFDANKAAISGAIAMLATAFSATPAPAPVMATSPVVAAA